MSFRSKIIAQTDSNKVFWFLVSAVVFMAVLYLYSINLTVTAVAQRESIESKIAASRAAISALESKYIAEKSGITMELASNLGYKETSNVVYLSKRAVSVVARSETIQ